ncbi:hypothetical protein K439DRAFT_1343858 [Ramaria rubella]|nr:hypothetical protein K439DRAFT_1343858 [Ramaria rubella]
MDLHSSESKPGPVTSRTVHFSNKGQSLIATYLESFKIVAWNVDPWNKLWEGKRQSRIGHTALSPDGRHILIHNFRDGTDAYSIPNMFHFAVFHAPVSVSRPKQIVFASLGTLVVQGSDKGLVYISDFETAAPVQTLVHTTGKVTPIPD